MEYLKKEKRGMEDYVIRYDVNLDISELENIRREIVDNCGLRHYVRKILNYDNPQSESLLIRNYNMKKMETNDDDTAYEDTPVKYEETFVKITEPKLSKLIGAILDTTLREEDRIKLLDYVYGEKPLEEYQDNSIAVLNGKKSALVASIQGIVSGKKDISNYDINLLEEAVNGLKETQRDLDLNEGIDPNKQKEYIPVIKEAIILNQKSSIDYASYQKVKRFEGKDIKL